MSEQEIQVAIYDPKIDAKYSVTRSTAIRHILEAKKLEQKLIAKGTITANDTKVE